MRTVGLAIALVLVVSATPAAAVESPDAGSERECRVGELCRTGGTRPAGPRPEAVDPPGDHVQSIATLGAIFAVVGTYLFTALTGRGPRRRLRDRRSRRPTRPGGAVP